MSSAVVFTISDSRSKGQAVDLSGPQARDDIEAMGLHVDGPHVVPDEIDAIRNAVRNATKRTNLVVTTGGTGVSERDVTPEAIGPILDRSLPGFGEIMRTGSYSVTPLSIISRGGAGIVGRCLVVMLPGSPAAVRDGLALLGPSIKHVLRVLSDVPNDCAQATQSKENS